MELELILVRQICIQPMGEGQVSCLEPLQMQGTQESDQLDYQIFLKIKKSS